MRSIKIHDSLPKVIEGIKSIREKISLAEQVLKWPLQFFVPTGKQEEFVYTIANSTKNTKIPVVLLTAANGIGKTTVAIMVILNFIFGPQNGYFDYPIFKNFPFPKLVWYISTPTALAETVEPEFRRLLKNHPEAQFNKNGKTTLDEIKINDWTIKFKTFNQDVGEFESANVGIINIDEPAPEPIWRAVKSRRRKGCITMLPLTPLYCPPYLMDEVKMAADVDLPGYYHLKADVYSACKKRGIRGHLDPDVIDDMVKGYGVEERQARAFGEFAYFSGLIYPMLNANMHRVDPRDYPIPAYSVIKQVVDPHDSRPHACGYMALCPNGRIIWFDETPEKKTPYWDMKSSIPLEDEIKSWINIEDRFQPIFSKCSHTKILDKRFGWQTRGLKTYVKLLRDEGDRQGRDFNFRKSYDSPAGENELTYGHELVRQQLKPLADGLPGMVFWNTCYHIWEGLTHYVKKNETSKAAGDRAAGTGKIIEKYKDFPDVVRYGVADSVLPARPIQKESFTERYLRKLEEDYEREHHQGEAFYEV